MIKIDVVCPLYRADDEIDAVIEGLKAQKNIILNKVVFPITLDGDVSSVIEKIEKADLDYFCVAKSDFSHSLTREKAIIEYCESDVVLMLTQDVRFANEDSAYILASAVNENTVYAYGRQICTKKTVA